MRLKLDKMITVLLLFILNTCISAGQNNYDLIIAKDGSGDYSTFTEAFNNLPMYNYERFIIYVKNGIYKERFRIERDYITIIGESRDSTIIQFSLLRSDWDINRDYIGNAVVNIYADDVVLKNLTIKNTQPEIGPHAFAVYGTGTRTVIVNCSIMSNGADTISLWNYKEGMYYHANCYFEGAVDMVCPRGWCYIRDSQFFELKNTAAIWHAAVNNPNQKFVIRNSTFDGIEGFHLGRHHYEAMFFLLDCKFSDNMADQPIYRVTYPDNPARNRPYVFGDRKYFGNCKKDGEEFEWYKDNLDTFKKGITSEKITSEWCFDGKWNPENSDPPRIKRWEVKENKLFLYFYELMSVRGKPVLKLADGTMLEFSEGRGRDILVFSCNKILSNKINWILELTDGELLASVASENVRRISNEIILENQ